MKPTWDQLMSDYEGSKHAGIFDVDCTADGKDLCSEVGVTGYPTIKWGDPTDKTNLKAYEGGRDVDSLKKFAEENLGPLCTPASLDVCSDEDRVLLEGFVKKSAAELLADANKLNKEFAATQKKLDKKTSKLKDQRQEYKEDIGDHSSSKPKKGKEAEHKAKTDKLEARRVKLEATKEALDKEQDRLKSDIAKSGVKLMALAAQANKDRTDL